MFLQINVVFGICWNEFEVVTNSYENISTFMKPFFFISKLTFNTPKFGIRLCVRDEYVLYYKYLLL